MNIKCASFRLKSCVKCALIKTPVSQTRPPQKPVKLRARNINHNIVGYFEVVYLLLHVNVDFVRIFWSTFRCCKTLVSAGYPFVFFSGIRYIPVSLASVKQFDGQTSHAVVHERVPVERVLWQWKRETRQKQVLRKSMATISHNLLRSQQERSRNPIPCIPTVLTHMKIWPDRRGKHCCST